MLAPAVVSVALAAAPGAPPAPLPREDPIAPVLIALTVILLGAKLGGEIFERIGRPAVLGELIVGILLGNLDYLFGVGIFENLRSGPAHDLLVIFAGLGAVVLLFEVGLATSVQEMLRVGVSATLVATAGVIAPWILGTAVAVLLLPGATFASHLFLGATLTATSVGITARVFKDLGRIESPEARIILGAAVIDDVLGLIVLAVVSGIVVQGAVGVADVSRIMIGSTLFLFGAVLLGGRFAPVIAGYLASFRVRGMKLITALSICFAMAWLAGAIGLAPIVGAFAAGLVLEEAHFVRFDKDKPLKDLLEPFSSFFVPIFFVVMGIEVHLEAFADARVLGIAAAITLAAILGKQVCGIVALGRDLDRVIIGFGMIPRGEVGLIFASIGRSLGVVDDSLYAVCVVMVISTTLIAPFLLQWRMRRTDRSASREVPIGGPRPPLP